MVRGARYCKCRRKEGAMRKLWIKCKDLFRRIMHRGGNNAHRTEPAAVRPPATNQVEAVAATPTLQSAPEEPQAPSQITPVKDVVMTQASSSPTTSDADEARAAQAAAAAVVPPPQRVVVDVNVNQPPPPGGMPTYVAATPPPANNNGMMLGAIVACVAILAIAAGFITWLATRDNNGSSTPASGSSPIVIVPAGNTSITLPSPADCGPEKAACDQIANAFLSKSRTDYQNGVNEINAIIARNRTSSGGPNASGSSGGFQSTSNALIGSPADLRAIPQNNCAPLQGSSDGTWTTQSGENKMCSWHLTGVKSDWVLVADGIGTNVNGDARTNSIKAYSGLPDTFDVVLTTGAFVIGPHNNACPRFDFMVNRTKTVGLALWNFDGAACK